MRLSRSCPSFCAMILYFDSGANVVAAGQEVFVETGMDFGSLEKLNNGVDMIVVSTRYLFIHRFTFQFLYYKMKKQCVLFFHCILLYILIVLLFLFLLLLLLLLHVVPLSITAVVCSVVWMVAALRRVIAPIHTFPNTAFATAVGADKHQWRKFFDIHQNIDHISFRLQ